MALKKTHNIYSILLGVLLLNISFLNAQDSTNTANNENISIETNASENSEFKLIKSAEFLTACGCGTSFNQVEKSDNIEGLKVLEKGYQIAYVKKEIITGSCWDFVNAVYNRTGKEYQKTTVYSTKKSEKKYADKKMLKPGDWIYHINYDYSGVEHSAIFVCWKDFEQGKAVTLSYAGQNRKQAGRFGVYNLNGVYSIFRLKKKEAAAEKPLK
jgi:hypothetical protein